MTDDSNAVPIVKITIDDSALQAFRDKFAAIQKDAESLPKAWEAAEVSVSDAANAINKKRPGRTGGATAFDGLGPIRIAIDLSTTTWGTISTTSRTSSREVRTSTLSLERWARLKAVFSGLLGAGGLFGLNRLAADTATKRQSAMGRGISIGQQSAFGTDFSPLGNTDALLNAFSAAAADSRRWAPFNSLGIDPSGKDAVEVFTEALPKIQALLQSTDPTQMGGIAKSYGLEGIGFDQSTLLNLRNGGPNYARNMVTQFRIDSDKMGIPDDIALKWQDFDTTMDRAGTKIGTALAGSLVNIEPGLSEMTDSITDIITTLMRAGGPIDGWLHELGGELKYYADELGSPENIAKMKSLLDGFASFNRWVASTPARTIDQFPKTLSETTPGDVLGAAGRGIASWWHGPQNYPTTPAGGAGDVIPSHDYDKKPSIGSSPGEHHGGAARAQALAAEAASPGRHHGSGITPKDSIAGGGNDSWLDDRSRRELSGVNKDLADSLLQASDQSGIQFKVLQGRRTQAEANANAAKGTGVVNSQHLYGAATDLRMIDPATGKPTYDRAVYARFADSFDAINRKKGNHQRWLGRSGWHNGGDIVHFDQGLGYGQSHKPDPYGHAEAPTQADIRANSVEILGSPFNPFTQAAQKSSMTHPNATAPSAPNLHVVDNTGGSVTITGPH